MYIIAELKWIFHSSGHAATSRYYIKVPTHWSHEVEVGPEKNLSFFVTARESNLRVQDIRRAT